MNTGKLVFAQLTDLIHPEQFRRCVLRYQGDYKVKSFSCWDQFLCMAFGQLTFRASQRYIYPKRYVWKAKGAEILAKIRRAREALEEQICQSNSETQH